MRRYADAIAAMTEEDGEIERLHKEMKRVKGIEQKSSSE